MTTPKVSICCLCYNHEKYIRQCLDGIIMQQTSFPFEALVHDDASTDGSRQIILEYAEKYPAIIKPILQDENQYSKGKGILGTFLCPRCPGEYVAFCECDDYWTDPTKLQKQVDFLDSHREYSFCCHRYRIYEENTKSYRKEYAYDWYKEGENLEITESVALSVWVTQMLTTLIRKDIFLEIMQTVNNLYHTSRDNYIFYELLQVSKGISLNQDMGIYRWHDGGIASSTSGISRYGNAVKVYSNIYKKHIGDHILEARLRYNYERLLRYTSPSRQGWQILKDSFGYCNTTMQQLYMIAMYLIPPFLLRIPAKLYSKYLRKKCSISNP